MAGAYTVVISATDLASGVFDAANKRVEALNKRVAAATAPFRRFGESLEKFSKVTGLSEIATGFSNVARTGTDAFRSLARIVEPLAAIVGVASIAGVYRLTAAWGEFASALGNQAQRAGASASQLYVLQNAARLAGVDAETLTSGITTLNDNLRNAAFGGAPAFLNVLANLHLSFEDLQKMNPEQRLKAISDALSKVSNTTDRALFTKEIFGGEGMIPFLNAGAAGITAWEEAARRLGGTMTEADIARAQAFRQAQVGLAESVTGLGNAIANVLGPALTPLVSELSGAVSGMRQWIDANQDWLRSEISTRVGEFVTWVKAVDWHAVAADIQAIATKADAVAQALGGWEKVGEGIVLFIAGSWFARMLLPFVQLTAAVGQLTFAIGTTLVNGFVLAGDAAVLFNQRAMSLPVFKAMAVAAGVFETMRGGALVSDLPADSPLRRVGSAGSGGGGILDTVKGWLGYSGAAQTQGDGDARNLRNNNPTNLTFAGQPGATSDGRFARFPSLEAGVAADLNQFLLYQDRDNKRSIADMIHKATPASDNNPGVEGYIDRVAAQMGMRRDEAPDLHNREVASRFIMAVAPNEGGTPDRDAVQRGVDARLGPAATLPSAAAGAPGANGRVDVNVKVQGDQSAVVTGKSTGGADLYVARSGLLGAQ